MIGKEVRAKQAALHQVNAAISASYCTIMIIITTIQQQTMLSQVVHEYLQNSNYVVMTIASLVVGYIALVTTLRFNIKNKNDKLDPNDPRQAFEILR